MSAFAVSAFAVAFAVSAFAVSALPTADHTAPATPTRRDQRACVDRSQIRWQPAVPRSGTLFSLSLAGSGGQSTAVTRDAIASMMVSGERVFFVGVKDSSRALAPIPLDSSLGVTLRVTCTHGDTVEIRIPTTSGDYTLEPLRVAPRFTAPPKAALAERMRREAERAALVSMTSRSTPPLWRLPFVAPRASRITSPYGGGRVFNGTVTSRHMGTDYAGSVGAAVYATNRGVVRLVDRFYLAGNVIYVDHGGALVSAYLHLSRAVVRVGDTVSAGSLIGYVGATGRVTGPHLHFALRYGSISIDPTSALSLR